MPEPVALPSRIDRVQVYRRGATVTRDAELTLDGHLPDEIELTDLPLTLVDPTVRVRVLAVAPAGAEVVAAGVRVGLWVRAGDPPPKAPEQVELEAVRRRLRDAREQLAVIEAEVEVLQGVPVPERPTGEDGKPPPASPMAARLHLEQFVDEATGRRLTERRALREQVRELEESEARVEERIAAASSAAEVHLPELRKSAVVRLRASGAAPSSVKLELSYVVPGARWAPAYQCKLARDGSHAEIQMRAWIAQRSGEDWRGVSLRLSTASPLRFSELPELSSIKIGRAQPPPKKPGFRPPPQGGDLLFRDFDRELRKATQALPAPRGWHAPALEAATMPPALAPPPPRAPAKQKKSARSRGESTGVYSREELAKSADVDGESMDGGEHLFDDAADERASTPPPSPRAPSPAAAMAPMESMALGRAAPAGKAARGPSGGGGDDAALALFTFPLLRLPSADQAGGRGRLVPLDVREHYRVTALRRGRPVPFDVMSAVQSAEEEARAVLDVALPDGAVDADDITSHFDFAYEADGAVDVVGDGGFHSVALGDRACEARMRYVAVPREEANVYRVAMLMNPIPAPLLPGPAEVYVGGEYVLTTRLPTVPARGELKLGLGAEQAIKVARNTRFSEARSGEKVVAMAELAHDVDIDVVNHLERDIEIEVRERVPVPAPGAEVVVEEVEVTPAWQPYDQQERGQIIEGGRRWEVRVGKGASERLRARYVVKIYAQNEIVGGNRREA
ncbi:MAG: DUF4139 domain-containing protein [Deltaproteobacteria bacterium]|nr:DUF4139 domain-containing protein [Deltaproteobacteria bacterium]